MSPKVLLKLGPAMPPNWTPKFIWGGGGGQKMPPSPEVCLKPRITSPRPSDRHHAGLRTLEIATYPLVWAYSRTLPPLSRSPFICQAPCFFYHHLPCDVFYTYPANKCTDREALVCTSSLSCSDLS